MKKVAPLILALTLFVFLAPLFVASVAFIIVGKAFAIIDESPALAFAVSGTAWLALVVLAP